MCCSRRITSSVIVTALLLAPALPPARAQPGPAAQADDKRRLLEEAGRVETPRFILNADAPPEAVELAHRMEAFAKELQVAWLTRGLDEDPLPANLAARLSPEGAAHRKRFVADLERMAILTLKDPAPPPRKPGRRARTAPKDDTSSRRSNPPPREGPPDDQQGHADEIQGRLHSFAQPVVRRFGNIDYDDARKLAQISPNQFEHFLKLDEIARSALKSWFISNVDPLTPESLWQDNAFLMRKAIIDLSNRVIYAAVLSPEQSEKLKRAIWARHGTNSLLDPELAARLGIKKEQSAMIKNAMAQSDQDVREAAPSVVALINRSDDPLEKQHLYDQLKQLRNEANQVIWDQLTPSQLSKLRGLIGDGPPKDKPARRGTPPRPARAP